MVSKENNVITAKKYYIGEYEYTDSVEANRKKEVTYITAPTGLGWRKSKQNGAEITVIDKLRPVPPYTINKRTLPDRAKSF